MLINLTSRDAKKLRHGAQYVKIEIVYFGEGEIYSRPLRVTVSHILLVTEITEYGNENRVQNC